jgi:hypothetical protein
MVSASIIEGFPVSDVDETELSDRDAGFACRWALTFSSLFSQRIGPFSRVSKYEIATQKMIKIAAIILFI